MKSLETDRIILRSYQHSDWERVHLYGSLPDFAQYDSWGPNSEEDTKNFIQDAIHKTLKNPQFEYEFAIIDKKSNLLIGGCGIRRDDSSSSVANLGYAINPDFQGKGFASECTKLLLKFGFNELKLFVIYATCDSENIASFKVMEKCKMKKVGFYIGKRKFKNKISDEFRYEITKEEFILLHNF
jgi:ribosomal-protein-alanine N-acetyltransferase